MRKALVRAIVSCTFFLFPFICQAQTSLPPGWSHSDVGAIGLTGSASYANGTFTVAGSGTQITGNADSMHFVYQPWSGNGTFIARLASVQGVQGGTFPYAGVMIRETLNANSRDAFTVDRPNYGIQTIWRPSTGGSSSYQDSTIPNPPLPYWLKVVRSGSTFSSYASPDGIAWTQVGSIHTVTMAQNVYIGLAVSSAVNTSLVTATFDNVSINPSTPPAPVITSIWPTKGVPGFDVLLSGSGFGNSQGTSVVTLNGAIASVNTWNATSISVTIPPGANSGPLSVSVAPSMNTSNPFPFLVTSLQPPWLDQDVGAVGVTGKASYANGTFTVAGSGTQITGNADSMHFVYQPWSGNGTFIARLASVQGVQSGTFPYAGVMIRETLNANSINAFTVHRPNYRIQTVWRASTGGGASYQDSTITNPPPYWLKIVRSGSTFSSYASPDGVTWTLIGSIHTITMAQNVYIGFAVCSAVSTSLVTATFDNVSITPSATGAPLITDINPFSGAIGTPLTISGVNFSTQGTNTVTFNGVTGTPSMWSPTAIVVPVPPAATSGNVVVHVGALNSNAAPFTVLTAPTITSLSPTSGLVGTSVTITGANFGSNQGSSTVKFNGVAAAPAPTWGAISIQVPVPTGATSGNVVVTVSGIASNVAYFTVPSSAPSIANLNPASGPVGASVTIMGTNFGTSPGAVTFNGRTASTSTWSNATIVATVPSGTTTGPVLVTVNGVASNPATFTVYTVQPGSPSLLVNPNKINMVVGQTQAIQLLDQNGMPISNPSWSIANPSLASIIPPVNQGDPTLLQSSAVGNTTLTGTSADSRTGTAQVSILGGTSLPVGTVQWGIPSLGTGTASITNIVQSLQVNGSTPGFYLLDSGANGGSGAFRAFTADGQQKWMFVPSAPSNEELKLFAADNQGGFIYQRDDWSDLPMVGRVDQNGNQSWLLSTPGIASNVAIHPDGTVYTVQQDYLNTGQSPTAVVALDGSTGQTKFAIPLPTQQSTGVDYSWLSDPMGGSGGDGYPLLGQYCTPGAAVAVSNGFGKYGSLSISSDGTVYLPIGSGSIFYDAMPCDSSPDPLHPGFPHLVKSTDGVSSASSYLQVMAIHSDGSYSMRQLDSASSSQSGYVFPGLGGIFYSIGLGGATPDGNGGTLLAVNKSGWPSPSAFYHDTGSVVSTLNLSLSPTGEILLGGDGTAYVTGSIPGTSAGAALAINTTNNAINWTYSPSSGNLSPVAAIGGGGIAINNSQTGLIQLDSNGNASTITSGYTISQVSYSWSGDWYTLTPTGPYPGVLKVLAPITVDPGSWWAILGGNPSEAEAAVKSPWFPPLPSCYDATLNPPLSCPGPKEAIYAALAALDSTLNNACLLCQANVFNKVSINQSDFAKYLQKARFYDGTKSEAPRCGELYLGSFLACLNDGWTVAHYFEMTGPTLAAATLSPSFPVQTFFRPSSISLANGGVNVLNMAMMFHEALHGNQAGLTDAVIQNAFGCTVLDDTRNITWYLEQFVGPNPPQQQQQVQSCTNYPGTL